MPHPPSFALSPILVLAALAALAPGCGGEETAATGGAAAGGAGGSGGGGGAGGGPANCPTALTLVGDVTEIEVAVGSPATVSVALTGGDGSQTIAWKQTAGPRIELPLANKTPLPATHTPEYVHDTITLSASVTQTGCPTVSTPGVSITPYRKLDKRIFVSPNGDDANNGTAPASPVKTLVQGLSLAAATGADVHVQKGEYVQAATLVVPDQVGLYGGYVEVAGSDPKIWHRVHGEVTKIYRNLPFATGAEQEALVSIPGAGELGGFLLSVNKTGSDCAACSVVLVLLNGSGAVFENRMDRAKTGMGLSAGIRSTLLADVSLGEPTGSVHLFHNQITGGTGTSVLGIELQQRKAGTDTWRVGGNFVGPAAAGGGPGMRFFDDASIAGNTVTVAGDASIALSVTGTSRVFSNNLFAQSTPKPPLAIECAPGGAYTVTFNNVFGYAAQASDACAAPAGTNFTDDPKMLPESYRIDATSPLRDRNYIAVQSDEALFGWDLDGHARFSSSAKSFGGEMDIGCDEIPEGTTQ